MSPVSDIGKIPHSLGKCEIPVKLMAGDAEINKKTKMFLFHIF